MKKNKNGFVVSAVLYPLLVLFLALIMGLLSMTDTRKRILDRMKLEISESIFDESTCSCDTILNLLKSINSQLKNGVGGGSGGSYTYNVLGLNVTAYSSVSDLPNINNAIGDIAVITDTEISSYYVSTTVPSSPKEGLVWIVQDNTSSYYVTSDWSKIGISYVMQYENNKWVLKKAYVYDNARWELLYYVSLKDGYVDLTSSDINAQIVHTYNYTGTYQTFNATFSGYYKIELWGAQGGTYSNGTGGKGAYTSGEIYLNAGESLYIYVGQQPTSTTGGWNGGGNGYSGSSYVSYGGGGATDVRLVPTSEKNIWNEFDSLKSRIMVAAGGGSGGYYGDNTSYYGTGGAGGGLNGYSGSNNHSNSYSGTGGTQTKGGYRSNSLTLNVGGFGYGGTPTYDGAGGGGYYGGGGGYNIAAGGGGSSYISGHSGCNSIEEVSTSTNIVHNGSGYHYSGYYFINTIMIDGAGYSWSNIKETQKNMPSQNGSSTMTGNSGNGYAKITLETVEVISKDDITTIRNNNEKTWLYGYSGTYQTFKATFSGYYKIELWGAQGGSYGNGNGGKGAYTSGEIYLNAGEKLYIYVGQQPISTTGGWNGGGNGYSGGSYVSYGGGGATDVRTVATTSLSTWNETTSLKSRIMVAAGGGSGGYYGDSTSYYGTGGAGGGLNGYSGSNNHSTSYSGTGGTQTQGGYKSNSSTSNVGGFGYGGVSSYDGAGGGGYYGGGGGYNIAAGGGGSSYISGHVGCNSIEKISTSTNISHNGSSYHYSGYYFLNTVMIDGQGYPWTTAKSVSSSGMPSPTSTSMMTGNAGNGYAKITLVTVETISKDDITTIRNDNEKTWLYSYSGTYQTFTAIFSGTYKIELWGAQGGTYGNGSGGKGAYTSGEINLKTGEKLYIYVGQQSIITTGGWNGGGNGYSSGSYVSYGGGGATDVRTVATTSLSTWNEAASLKSRIMVAAGGGSGGYYGDNTSYYGTGGAGGGLNGYSGSNNHSTSYSGTGGTQTKGGYRSNSTTSNVGGFGYGGVSSYDGAGGSGWYGGGGGYNIAAGGGGSSYISGHAGCIAVTSSGTSKVSTYTTLTDSISYTGYTFTNTSMIDGAGYPWTTEKSATSSGMPSYSSSSLMTGNTGNGYARITYLGA